FVEKKQRKDEIARLREALKSAAREARENQDAISAKVGKQYGAIFAAHALLIQDPELLQEMEKLIREHDHAAEYAVSRVMRRHVKTLESLGSSHFSTRAADLVDIEKAVLRHLLGGRGEVVQHLKEPVVVLAHDLTPSETAALDPKMVHAFATEA